MERCQNGGKGIDSGERVRTVGSRSPIVTICSSDLYGTMEQQVFARVHHRRAPPFRPVNLPFPLTWIGCTYRPTDQPLSQLKLSLCHHKSTALLVQQCYNPVYLANNTRMDCNTSLKETRLRYGESNVPPTSGRMERGGVTAFRVFTAYSHMHQKAKDHSPLNKWTWKNKQQQPKCETMEQRHWTSGANGGLCGGLSDKCWTSPLDNRDSLTELAAPDLVRLLPFEWMCHHHRHLTTQSTRLTTVQHVDSVNANTQSIKYNSPLTDSHFNHSHSTQNVILLFVNKFCGFAFEYSYHSCWTSNLKQATFHSNFCSRIDNARIQWIVSPSAQVPRARQVGTRAGHVRRHCRHYRHHHSGTQGTR